jgi:outer membrane murein-binding lipoprotein Lpp
LRNFSSYKRYFTLSAATLAAVFVLSGCASRGPASQNADRATTTAPSVTAAQLRAEHNDADTALAHMMIRHGE